MNFGDIFLATLPVFLILGLGFVIRVTSVIDDNAERRVVSLILNLLYPCFILSKIPGNESLQEPGLVMLAFGIGFGLMATGMLVAFGLAWCFRIDARQGLKTFCLATSIQNYGFIPIPLIEAIYPDVRDETLGVLFVHNLGLETALWTIGLFVLSGSIRGAWKRLINGPTIGIAVGLLLNFSGYSDRLPEFAVNAIGQLGNCAIPISLLVVGATICSVIQKEKLRFNWRIISAATLARFLIMPIIFMSLATMITSSPELRRVLLVEAAMPSAVFPIVLAKHYGGQPAVATQVVLSTTALSVVLTPAILTFALFYFGTS